MSVYEEIGLALLGVVVVAVLGLVFLMVLLVDLGTVFRLRLGQRYADWLREL